MRDQTVVPLEPAKREWTSAPKVTTVVLSRVLAVVAVKQAVPMVEVQVYVSKSPTVGGLATEGPLAGVKSEVILTEMVPRPMIWEVRTRKLKAVVPVYGAVAEAAVSVVVPVLMVMDAEAATVRLREVVPVVCASEFEAKRAASRNAGNRECRIEKECFMMR